MKYKYSLIVALLTVGCARTEITRMDVRQVSGTPYHKVLVCTLSGVPARASLMETTMTRELKKNGITADRCMDVYSVLRDSSSVDQTVANIQKQSYDAVLIIQRKPVPSYPKIQDFIAAYEKGIPPVPKSTAPLDGTAELFAVHENEVIWSADGLLYGDPNAPLPTIFQAFAELIENGLQDQGIIASH